MTARIYKTPSPLTRPVGPGKTMTAFALVDEVETNLTKLSRELLVPKSAIIRAALRDFTKGVNSAAAKAMVAAMEAEVDVERAVEQLRSVSRRGLQLIAFAIALPFGASQLAASMRRPRPTNFARVAFAVKRAEVCA